MIQTFVAGPKGCQDLRYKGLWWGMAEAWRAADCQVREDEEDDEDESIASRTVYEKLTTSDGR